MNRSIGDLLTCFQWQRQPQLSEMLSLSSEKLEFAEGCLLQNSVPASSHVKGRA